MAAQPHVTQLVIRLLSQPSSERERALAMEDPSALSSAEYDAVGDALLSAREQGQLSAGTYHEILTQVEQWYFATDRSSTHDPVPALFDFDEPTAEIVSNRPQRIEFNPDTASLGAVRKLDLDPSPAAATPPPIAPQSSPAERPAAEPAAPPASRPQFVLGATIGERYVLEEQIGSGGTALVFRARDLRRDAGDEDAHVALKVARERLRDSASINERLKREFDQSRALPYPGIVRVFDLDCDQGTWYLTMELLHGVSLSGMLAGLKSGRLPREDAFAIIKQCGEALAFAHERGVLHCDLKPGNVFVTAARQVRVLDFGVVTCSTATRESAVPGGPPVAAATPCYASPDVLTGKPPNQRDDVFSLACLSYEVLTGRHPFGRRSTVDARDSGMRVPRVAGLSRQEFRALERGLAWSNRRCPASVSEFLAELGVLPHRPRISLGRNQVAAVGLVLVAASAFLVQWLAGRGTDEPASAPQSVAVARSIPIPAPSDPQSAPPADQRQAASDVRSALRSDRAAAASAAAPSRPIQAPSHGGLISLEQANLVVDERAASVVVRVRRFDDQRGAAQVRWHAIPGTATPGSDYTVENSGLISFPDGHDLRVLYFPIQNDALKEGNESFEIELLPAAGRSGLGQITRSTITILDDD